MFCWCWPLCSKQKYSLFVVPRVENVIDASFVLRDALAESGVDCRLVETGLVEIAGQPFHVMRVGVVRDRDAVLIAHLQNRPPAQRREYIVGMGQNDVDILEQPHGRTAEPTVVVADRISELARKELSRAEVAWLDRRGHLWVKVPGVFVNADVSPSVVPPPRVVDALSGTGFDVAVALLASPGEDVGVNELARRVHRSPGRVSEILSALRGEGLVEGGNRPSIPELFWDVAERWSPRWEPLSTTPPVDAAIGYRLSGTLAALSLGAPVVAGPIGSWPRLYVAKDSELSSLVTAYGRSGSTAAEIAVCPSRFGATMVSSEVREGFHVAHPVLVALDLAQDRARGREVLDAWQPTEVIRVW